jgi:translation initiation factor 1
MAGKDSSRSPIAKVRLEKRAGKTITVIVGLHTYGTNRLETIARELKQTLGAGGTVKKGIIEIQGDKVVPVKAWFLKKIPAGG